MKKIANEFLTSLEQTEIKDFFKSLINFDRKTRLQRREDAYYVHLGVSEYINENYEILIYDSVYKKYTETYVFFDSEGVYIKDLETLKGLFRKNLYQEKKDFIQTKVNEFLDTFLSKHNLLNPEMLAFVRRWNSGKATQQDFDTKFHWETILNNEFDSFWWEQIVAPIAEEYVQQAQEILKGKVVFKRKHSANYQEERDRVIRDLDIVIERNRKQWNKMKDTINELIKIGVDVYPFLSSGGWLDFFYNEYSPDVLKSETIRRGGDKIVFVIDVDYDSDDALACLLLIEGNTYPIKDILKEHQFRWLSWRKAWGRSVYLNEVPEIVETIREKISRSGVNVKTSTRSAVRKIYF